MNQLKEFSFERNWTDAEKNTPSIHHTKKREGRGGEGRGSKLQHIYLFDGEK